MSHISLWLLLLSKTWNIFSKVVHEPIQTLSVQSNDLNKSFHVLHCHLLNSFHFKRFNEWMKLNPWGLTLTVNKSLTEHSRKGHWTVKNKRKELVFDLWYRYLVVYNQILQMSAIWVISWVRKRLRPIKGETFLPILVYLTALSPKVSLLRRDSIFFLSFCSIISESLCWAE